MTQPTAIELMDDNWIEGVTLAHLVMQKVLGLFIKMKWNYAIEYKLDGFKIHDFYNDKNGIHDEIKCHLILLCKSMNDCYL